MISAVKKYIPYTIVIFAVFLLVPLIFVSDSMSRFSPIAYYCVLLLTQVICSAVYCAKHGLDFLFTLIAPIAFLFTMMIYAGGFANPTNIILLIVYLIAGIFGLFLGDLAFGDARRKQEKKDKQAAEELLLQAKRRDELEKQRMARESESKDEPKTEPRRRSGRADSYDRAPRYSAATESKKESPSRSYDDDDFDYDKYLSDIDKMLDDIDEEKSDY